jgi:hypothetical protein
MKHEWKVFLIGVMVLFFVFPGRGSGDTMETFEIRGDTGPGFSISIESYREANGWTPMVLCFGDLEIALAVSTRQLAAEGIDSLVDEILTGSIDLDFILYEQNPVRTRMGLADETVPITMKLNRENQQAIFFIGGVPLKSGPLRVVSEEITSRGWQRFIFSGKGVRAYKTFIYQPLTNTIHAVPHRCSLSILNPGNGRVWARGISPKNPRGGSSVLDR